MFINKAESEKGELEIVYDVQWKTPGNDDDKAKIIGIVDTKDTNLDWSTFKSYLIQSSGNNMRYTTDDIRISYLDSDDDLIPIDSDIEFRECLKFSRTRARRGRKIMMKINMIANGGAKPKDTKHGDEVTARNFKTKMVCLKKKDLPDKTRKSAVPFDKAYSTPPASSPLDGENKELMPEWFEKYMKKFKSDLVQEITAAVVSNVRVPMEPVPVLVGNSALTRTSRPTEMPSTSAPAGKGHHHHHHHLHNVLEKRKKKKKMPEEDSSDCTDGLQLQWEERLELLRHMQKINKREKKFEKKLDAKLEKLECKTKKIIEKKHCFFGGKKSGNGTVPTLPATPSAPACNLVMDATPVDEYNYIPHVLRGEVIDKIWKVMNNGQTAWTDETELRFAWGSKSLVPLTTVVKCPLLKPGETGRVAITLQVPLFPGNFESYWHFHHQGRRFGHWLGCAVIVDAEPRPDTPPPYEASAPTVDCLYQTEPGTHPVDLTMKCPSYDNNYKQSTTDDMKIYNIETNPEPTEDEIVQSKMIADAKKRIAMHCRRNRQQYINLSDETGNEDDNNTENSFSNFSDSHELHEVRVADLLNIKEELCEAAGGIGDGASGGQGGMIDLDSPVKDGDERKMDKEEESIEGDVGEYISGSDSDNISIISGTVSVDTDDTEPSDEFVVVPMPTCINCDTKPSVESQQTLTTDSLSVTEPISVEIPKTPSDSDISQVQASDDNNNNTELKPFPEMPPIFLPALLKNEPKQEAPADSKSETDDENTVYVRDAEGHSVPVAKVLKRPEDKGQSDGDMGKEPKIGIGFNVGVSHSVFGDPNFGHGPNGPRFPFGGFNEATGSPPPHCHNPGGPCNFRPQHEPPVCSVFINGMQTSQATSDTFCSHFCQPEQQQPPKQQKQQQQQRQQQTHQQQQAYQQQQQQPPPQQQQQQSQQQQSGRQTPIHGTFVFPPQQQQFQYSTHHKYEFPTVNNSTPTGPDATVWTKAFQNIHTEQPRACKYSYVYSGTKETPTQSKSSSSSSTTSSGTRRSTAEKHESSPMAAAVQILPDSLVTGAVNVASSAINTARSVIDMLRPRHDEPVVAQWDPIPTEVERSMAKLQEMGFNNRELNVMLLAKYNNDVNRVISDLVQ